jgi:hypothetical protein
MGGPFKYKMITPIIFNDKPIIINTVLIFITPNGLLRGGARFLRRPLQQRG